MHHIRVYLATSVANAKQWLKSTEEKKRTPNELCSVSSRKAPKADNDDSTKT